MPRRTSPKLSSPTKGRISLTSERTPTRRVTQMFAPPPTVQPKPAPPSGLETNEGPMPANGTKRRSSPVSPISPDSTNCVAFALSRPGRVKTVRVKTTTSAPPSTPAAEACSASRLRLRLGCQQHRGQGEHAGPHLHGCRRPIETSTLSASGHDGPLSASHAKSEGFEAQASVRGGVFVERVSRVSQRFRIWSWRVP